MKSKAIVWFRQDLRLHDNEALSDAVKQADEVIPVYIIDPRVLVDKTPIGYPKTGVFRLKFILESLTDLKQNLQSRGADLIVRTGYPEIELFNLAKELEASCICCNRERTSEEVAVQDQLEKQLWTIGRELRYSRGKMLLHTQDLPFPVTHTPETFTQYRFQVERIVQVRAPIQTPERIAWVDPGIDLGTVPTMEELGVIPPRYDNRSVFPFVGGETAGLNRLTAYFQDVEQFHSFKDSRKNLVTLGESSKFSPWLAQGCLSPKQIYAAILDTEHICGVSESTACLFFELLERDYFRLIGKKYGNALFQLNGLTTNAHPSNRWDMAVFERWASARTGVPLVDAAMCELNVTGYLSNRGRLITASYFVHELLLDWRMGASYFETQLIDYDPCSNYGNWLNLAGLGPDQKGGRVLNLDAQAMKYDPTGQYVRQWLPDLDDIPQEWHPHPESNPTVISGKTGVKTGITNPLPTNSVLEQKKSS